MVAPSVVEDVNILKQNFRYNPSTGIIDKWDSDLGKFINVPNRLDRQGYLRVNFNSKNILAHRLAWTLYHNKWPDGILDHINRDKSDNRLINLRQISHRDNVLNADCRDYIKVCKRKNRYRIRFMIYSKAYSISFKNPTQAEIIARLARHYRDIADIRMAELLCEEFSFYNEFGRNANFVEKLGKWRARITIDGKRLHLGYFKTESEAFTAINEFKKINEVN